MNILLAGANGTTARHLVKRLAKAGHHVRGAVRKPEQIQTVNELGGEGVLMDLTQPETFAQNLDGIDAVVFAAGSGGEAVEAVDRDGAISLIDASKAANIDRFVMLSSIFADRPDDGPDSLKPYLHAKHDADEHLKSAGLNYTIVRPVALTDDAPTGKIKTDGQINYAEDKIPRADVAHVLEDALYRSETDGKVFEIASGEALVDQALREQLAA